MTALAPQPPATAAPARNVWQVAAPALVALAATVGVAAVYLIFVRTGLGQLVDEAAMQGAEVSHPRLIQILNRTLDGTSLLSLGVVCLVAASIGLVRKRIDLAVAAGVLVLGANATTQALKTELHRPNFGEYAPNSLPSGHTTAAVSVAFALVLVLPYAVRAAVSLAGAAYVTVIAVATVWAGWHRPSDTVAALLVVLAWGGAVVTVVRLRRRHHRARPTTGRSASRLATLPLTVAGAVAGAVGLVGLAGVAVSQTVLPDLVSDMAAFLGGSAGIAAATAGTFVIWVRLSAGDRPLPGDDVTDEADAPPRRAPRARVSTSGDVTAKTRLPRRRTGKVLR